MAGWWSPFGFWAAQGRSLKRTSTPVRRCGFTFVSLWRLKCTSVTNLQWFVNLYIKLEYLPVRWYIKGAKAKEFLSFPSSGFRYVSNLCFDARAYFYPNSFRWYLVQYWSENFNSLGPISRHCFTSSRDFSEASSKHYDWQNFLTKVGSRERFNVVQDTHWSKSSI